MLSICLFHSLSPSVVFYALSLSTKMPGTKKEKEKKLPYGLLMGPADKAGDAKIKNIQGYKAFFLMAVVLQDYFFLGGKHEKISLCVCFSLYLSKSGCLGLS